MRWGLRFLACCGYGLFRERSCMGLQKPEMILFDYGCTLLHEPGTDFLRGEEAVYPLIAENPMGKTAKELCDFGLENFRQLRDCRHMGFEISEIQLLRCKYDPFGITFSVPLSEVEQRLWDAAAPGACMPGIEELLAFLHGQGIRTGVISNLGWTGEALRKRIDRLLPDNHFEFVLVSSDYAFRKPHPLMFRIALQKAGLAPERVWFCGDSMEADILGAHRAGMFPVLYEGEGEEGERSPYLEKNRQINVNFDLLHIHHWRELREALEG